VVVIVYNMAREAPRTLFSLSATYQRHIAADDYDTIGGYVLNQLGAAPKVGATLKLGNADLRVEAVQGTRIKKVRIKSQTPFQIPEPSRDEPTLSSTAEKARERESTREP